MHSDSNLKKGFSADMMKNKELNVDEKVEVQLWAESGMSTAMINSKLGRGQFENAASEFY